MLSRTTAVDSSLRVCAFPISTKQLRGLVREGASSCVLYVGIAISTKILFQVFTRNFRFSQNFFRDNLKNFNPGKTRLSSFSVLFKKEQKIRYEGAEDRAAAPLGLCHHSRAHETEQGRSQGHWQITTNRRRGSELLSSVCRVDKVVAPRRPTKRAR